MNSQAVANVTDKSEQQRSQFYQDLEISGSLSDRYLPTLPVVSRI